MSKLCTQVYTKLYTIHIQANCHRIIAILSLCKLRFLLVIYSKILSATNGILHFVQISFKAYFLISSDFSNSRGFYAFQAFSEIDIITNIDKFNFFSLLFFCISISRNSENTFTAFSSKPTF